MEVPVPSDGHCLLQSVAMATTKCDLDALKGAVWREINKNATFYEVFSTTKGSMKEIQQWLQQKAYRLGSVDLAINILCNPLNVNIQIVEVWGDGGKVRLLTQRPTGRAFNNNISLVKRGEHYQAVVRLDSNNDEDDQVDDNETTDDEQGNEHSSNENNSENGNDSTNDADFIDDDMDEISLGTTECGIDHSDANEGCGNDKNDNDNASFTDDNKGETSVGSTECCMGHSDEGEGDEIIVVSDDSSEECNVTGVERAKDSDKWQYVPLKRSSRNNKEISSSPLLDDLSNNPYSALMSETDSDSSDLPDLLPLAPNREMISNCANKKKPKSFNANDLPKPRVKKSNNYEPKDHKPKSVYTHGK